MNKFLPDNRKINTEEHENSKLYTMTLEFIQLKIIIFNYPLTNLFITVTKNVRELSSIIFLLSSKIFLLTKAYDFF